VEKNVSYSSSTNHTHATNASIQDVEDDIEYISDGIMRILFYRGCSGSSATFEILSDILAAHGLNRYWGNITFPLKGELTKELTKLDKNPFFKKAKQSIQSNNGMKEPNEDVIIIEALKLLNSKAKEHNKILSFKADYRDGEYLVDKLEDDALYTGMLRRNKLDRVLCFVKDCFGRHEKLGYEVHANNGTKVTDPLCFQRRQQPPNLKLKVYLHVHFLIEYMKRGIKNDDIVMSQTKGSITNVQYYEDLFAFVHTSDINIFQDSMNVWYDLLKPLLVHIDRKKIKNVLLPFKNSRTPPSPHTESVQNFVEVKNALEKATPPLDHFLRL